MTRKEAEAAIAEHLKEIQKISAEYAGGGYLNLHCDNEMMFFNNRYWKEEKKTPLDYSHFFKEVNND